MTALRANSRTSSLNSLLRIHRHPHRIGALQERRKGSACTTFRSALRPSSGRARTWIPWTRQRKIASLASPFRLASTLTAPLSCISLAARRRRSAVSRQTMTEADEQGGRSVELPPGVSPHAASSIGHSWVSYAWHIVLSDPLPRPAGIALARAVSTAYFALFHAVTLRAADLLAPGGDPRLRYRRVRDFQHRKLHRVAMWLAGSGTPPNRWASTLVSLQDEEDVVAVADAVLVLREARMDADYNHDASFTQNRAIALVATASRAASTVGSDVFAASDAGQRFLQIVADQVEARP